MKYLQPQGTVFNFFLYAWKILPLSYQVTLLTLSASETCGQVNSEAGIEKKN